jgi:hypothetical protein
MKKRETIKTSYFPTSLYKYVLMILTALLLSSCWTWVDKYVYGDYSIKPLEYDKQSLLSKIAF